MANTAQCYYCFESLSSSFEDHSLIDLATVEALWEQHEQTKKLSSLGSAQVDSEEEDNEEPGPPLSVNDESQSNQPKGLKPPAVSRLQSQASSSTTSSASNTSSNSLLSNSTAATTPSTQSALGSRKSEKYPLFVTWNTISRSGSKSLRGCIGTFEAQNLEAGLKSYARTSAFDDTRFSPITKSLLPALSCSLTLLGSFEPCTNPMDWNLGTHGLRISFIHRGRRYGATYLPDVAVEQGWSKEETVESLMRKAGWDGGAGGMARRLLRVGSGESGSTKPWDQVSDFKTTRYQGLKASASYEEWQEWRNWVLSLDDGRDLLGLA
ncbi:uncharacterized protein N7484_000692 [Penicillium longicatenatum]|uniref:uncharacterized protein n=1 Tax=Penicillium longicatenatum TaxID=1561947 RepID=UPI00254945FD|nr:uncharacterized protein N7484_000692 [Penicillium longicatenatum]KAJ5661320.1 hypothetical protein N7484_000692 [Penicillium longicatenatum]